MDKSRVVVAMSGGVDSSVCAYLMKAMGHQVIGVTFKLVDQPLAPGKKRSCCSAGELDDASQVAKKLGFQHHVIDHRDMFQREVVNPFITSYLNGATPNPCIGCNQTLKFGDVSSLLEQFDAEYFVTGHYVKLREWNGYKLLGIPTDVNRDQTYFLYSIPPSVLERVIFPLGELHKDEVRKIAEEAGLHVATKSDSQDVCFSTTSYSEFIDSKVSDVKGGEVVDEDGKTVGTHTGVHRFTVGQRRGLNVQVDGKRYVSGINGTTVYLSKSFPVSSNAELENVNWFVDPSSLPHFVDVKIRSQGELTKATVHVGESVSLHLESAQVLPRGQAAVIYVDDMVVGGGLLK